MSELSKELHMFVADQWVRGNANAPWVSWDMPWHTHFFVHVGNESREFRGVTAKVARGMLKGAGWYGQQAKLAQPVLQGASVDDIVVQPSIAYPAEIYVKMETKTQLRSEYLQYKQGNSPVLFLLAAYRAYQKAEKAKEIARDNTKFASTAQRYGTRPRKLGDLMPGRGHAKSALSNAQAEAAIKRDQKLNTLLLHRDLANALEAVNRVLHWGCNERQPPYPETGWKDVPLDKYKQALLRHQSEWMKDPSSLDEESGKLHLAHMATNALILLQRWPEEGKSGSTDH